MKLVGFNKQVSALLLAIFIDSLGWGVVYPVFASLFINNSTHLFAAATTLATRNFWFEFMIAIYCIFMFLASPVLGSLSDRYGRKIILIISLLGNSIGFIVSAIGIGLNSITIMIIGRILSGATAGSFTIAQAALMDISEPSQKAVRLGWIGLSNGIGFALGPIVGSFMIDGNLWHIAHYQAAFWFSAGLALIGTAFISAYFVDVFKGNKDQPIDILIGFHNIVDAFKANVRFYCGVMLFFMLGWNMFFNEIPIFLNGRFAAYGTIVGYFMAYVIAIFSLSLLVALPRLVKRFSIERLILVSLGIQFVFQILFANAQHWAWIWILAFPLVMAVPFTYVGVVTQVSNMTDANHQGKIMGVIGSIVAFTWGLGPILTGLLAKISFIAPYFVSVTVILIAFLLSKERKLLSK